MIDSSKFNLYIFYSLLGLCTIGLILTANTLSISYKEALNVFDNLSTLTILTYLPLKIFGFSDIALRIPFIILYALSAILMYEITDDYFKTGLDRVINSLIFMLLPGVISAGLLVNTSILVIFCTLLYLYIYKKYSRHCYLLLFIYVFIDNSFAVFFLALFFYAISKRETKLLVISLVFFTLSMYIYGFETQGKPQGHLLDTFGIYASVFSPFLFLYFFYAMYRMGVKGNRSIYWYISFTALVFSLLFSFRQKVYIEDFAPYVVITIPIMVKLFLHTYRVRLPQFRKYHRRILQVTLVLLFVNVAITVFNKPIYLFLEKPNKHFAYNYHIAKEVADILKKNNINNIDSGDFKLLKRLKFYSIDKGKDYYISFVKPSEFTKSFEIKYFNKTIKTLYIVKK